MPETPGTPDKHEPAPDEAGEKRRGDTSRPTPDRLLHTGGERPMDPEDLVRLKGLEPTPERIAEARRLLKEEGPAAAERYLP
ncbi:hypothetical protein [Streptomyces sp. 7-21]|jgi:hypothetical protein|uniref:hypothetical protein n=1 Tax=Streptomyces sp. 7-21 TaxID=2802283 RepID=UPI00191CAD1A|nr:hypothetical protein [Streptomyces sp. 7-21]MBL1068696.1 hypothetical protein [Streptomyces sp. 7-21]